MTATYTTSDKVKNEAGFAENSDISAQMVDGYRDSAYSIIRAMIAGKYDLTVMDADDDFSTSPAAALLDTIEKMYASALLLMKEYAGDDIGTMKGKDKMAFAEKLLKSILDDGSNVKLIDGDGDEYTTVASSVSGAPSRTGDTCDSDFTRAQTF